MKKLHPKIKPIQETKRDFSKTFDCPCQYCKNMRGNTWQDGYKQGWEDGIRFMRNQNYYGTGEKLKCSRCNSEFVNGYHICS